MTTLMNRRDDSLYSNAFGFLRLPLHFDPAQTDADVVITGVPFDLATTGRSGSRFGPEAIRKASLNLAWEKKRWPWLYSLEEHLSIVDCGDLVFECGNPESMTEHLERHAYAMLNRGKCMLTLGGDHFISLPLLRSHAKKLGPLALVHFDAHTDDYAQGGKCDHGTMFHHAQQEGLIDVDHSVQIGIRTTYDKKQTGFTVLEADTVNEIPVKQLIAQIHRTVADRPVYLTFDIDCLDPAFAPGTGTPVCGGLDTNRALQLVRGLKGLNIVGMDLVEVAPMYDQSEITALAAAAIAVDMLYLLT